VSIIDYNELSINLDTKFSLKGKIEEIDFYDYEFKEFLGGHDFFNWRENLTERLIWLFLVL